MIADMSAIRPHIVVLGSSNTDMVLRCTTLPAPGETVLGTGFQSYAGGKGSNQAVAAARAGVRVTLIGAHGRDVFGVAAKEGLKREGIDVGYFREKAEASSGVALIMLGAKGQNMIAVAPSANDLVSPEDVRAAALVIARSDAVVAQLEVPLKSVEAIAQLAAASGVPFILNPAPARKLPSRLLRLVHTLTPNECEAERLSGHKDPAEAGRALRGRGCQNVVVTLGARGVVVCDSSGEKWFPAPRVKAIDTVGAGDCFTGWLAAGLAEKLSLEEAVQRAIAAASISVTWPGAQASMPFRREVRSGGVQHRGGDACHAGRID